MKPHLSRLARPLNRLVHLPLPLTCAAVCSCCCLSRSRLWFDCAYAVSHSPTDLLSAANMRAKLVPASPAAEALYLHLLSLPAGAVGDNELRIAHRKLDALRDERATAAWQPTFDVENVDEEEEEAARSAWLSATVLRAHELGGGDEKDNASRGGGAEETAGGHEGEGEVMLMAESIALDYRRSAGGQLHAGHDASATVLASRRDWFAAPAADEENIDLENVTSRRRDYGL